MDAAHVTKARDLLFQDGEDWCAKGTFVSLICDRPAPDVSARETQDRVTVALRAVTSAEGNMLTVMERLDWMQMHADKDEHIKSRWCDYASADIEFWHVNLRSLLDQVGLVVWELAARKQQVPDRFHQLYNQSRRQPLKQGFAEKLGQDWLELLRSATWFDQIVCVRDEVVHRGGQTLVFGLPSDGILFQVHGRWYHRLVQSNPALMYNKNVVYFARYAADLMAHLLAFLEEFATIVYKRLGEAPIPNDTAMSRSPGYRVLKLWIDSALTADMTGVGTAIEIR